MKYKINKLDLLFKLYRIEDKRGYECKEITRHIDKLQKENKTRKILDDLMRK